MQSNLFPEDKPDYKKFVQEHVPFADLKKVGFFKKEIKFNEYEMIAKRFLDFFGYTRPEQYINRLPEFQQQGATINGKFPDKVDAGGNIKPGGGFHLSLAEYDVDIVCPICDCGQSVSISTCSKSTHKKCKGCKRKILIMVTKEGTQITEL